MIKRLPDREERRAYHEWFQKPMRMLLNGSCEICLSPQEVFDKLQNARYNHMPSVLDLQDLNLLQNRPVMIVGHSRGILYKVYLCSRLRPTKPSPDNRELMPDNILGINDNVEPNLKLTRRQRRNMALSEESTSSAESDDYDRTAFHIFHQFGTLMYYTGNFEEDGVVTAMNNSTEWADTGFAIVSDVTTGSARGVWLIYDFWPYDPLSTDRDHLQGDDDWGWLPNHEGDDDENDVQFSSAKVADSLNDLGRDYELKLEHKLTHEPELVNVVTTPQGLLLRQTIDKTVRGRVVS